MATLYVADPGAVVGRAGRYIRVECEDRLLTRVPARSLESVFVFGDATVTSSAVRLLAENEVQLAFLTRDGRLSARLLCGREPLGPPHRLRVQYRWAEDEEVTVASARAVVGAKLAAARALLLRQQRNHPHLGLRGAADEIRRLSVRAGGVTTPKALRGIEGRGAALYFGQLRHVIRLDTPFAGRVRRPPTDPANALLSFGYTMLRFEVEGQIRAQGLDPQVGFLHVERAGRPALALDLMEEFRIPVVDRLVLRCLNLCIVREQDCTFDQERGCRLNAEARRRFLREYDRAMTRTFRTRGRAKTTWRRMLHQQGRELLLAIREGRPYRPSDARL